nr:reverse transcriptase domain-containing protein [Tanacetum cinerariifolium]
MIGILQPNKNLKKVPQINQQVKAVTPSCETYGEPHCYNDCPATIGQTQNVYAAGAYQGGNSYQPQGASHGQNPPPAYQAPAYQSLGYQAPVHQPPIPQPQVVTTTEFTNYMKANDAILKNMQTNMTSLTNSNIELKNMFGQFMNMNTASSSGSGTLPSNTVTNPKEDLKGITTRSATAYQGPTISITSSSSPKVVERETETKRALIDVYAGELTLRVNNEAMTFNLDQTLRYSANYNDMTANRINVIDMACKENSQEVLSFSDEKSHFIVKEGIVLGHKISKNGIEVDKSKVDVIAKLPHPTTVKGIRSFLGHAGFYRRFIQDFLKIVRPMTSLLKKDTPFFFSKEYVEAFQTLKKKLTEAPILIAPD